MKYERQVIVYLDDDLATSANAFQKKREELGESAKSQIIGFRDQVKDLPENSRLVVIGHGVLIDGLRIEGIGNKRVPAKSLATLCRYWLDGKKIKRISLHMCYGGGWQGNDRSSDTANFNIKPEDSFAAEFAKYCGNIAVQITARTEEVNPQIAHFESGQIAYVRRVVGPEKGGAKRHHARGDKVIFVTDPASSAENPMNASKRAFIWKEDGKPKVQGF